ncbi:hypothetical protein D3C75_688760 [compost metagenome]
MVVRRVSTKLGVQRRHVPAQRNAPLPAVAGILVAAARYAHAFAGEVHTERRKPRHGCGVAEQFGAHVEAIAPIGQKVVVRKERATVVELGLFPVQLIETVDRQRFGEVLGEVEQVHRHQRVLHFRAGAAQGRQVEGVDDVQSALDEGALTPVDHLLAQPERTRLAVDVVQVVTEGIEQLATCGLG